MTPAGGKAGAAAAATLLDERLAYCGVSRADPAVARLGLHDSNSYRGRSVACPAHTLAGAPAGSHHWQPGDHKWTWKSKPKGVIAVGGDAIGPNTSRVILAEGESDALTIMRASDDPTTAVIAILGKGNARGVVSEIGLRWPDVTRVTLAFDNDTAGRSATTAAANAWHADRATSGHTIDEAVIPPAHDDMLDWAKAAGLQPIAEALELSAAYPVEPTQASGPPSREGPDAPGQRIGWALGKLSIETRYNERSAKVEYRGGDGDIPGINAAWAGIDEAALDDLHSRVVDSGGAPDSRGLAVERFVRLTRGQANANHRTDPFRDEYLLRLRWDGVSSAHNLLAECFYIPEEQLALAAALSTVILHQIAARTLDPGCKADQTVLLVGPAGIGKSTFCRLLLPPEYAHLFTDDVSLAHAGDKKAVEPTLGRAVVELSELAGYRRAQEIETVKAWLSRQTDTHRLAYAHDVADLPRRFAAIGTANPGDLALRPSDALARRMLPIPVSAHPDGWEAVFGAGGTMHAWRDRWLAEAVHRVRSGEPHHLKDDGLERAARGHYDDHTNVDPTEEAIAELPDAFWGLVGRSPTEIALEIGHGGNRKDIGDKYRPITEATAAMVGRACHRLGYISTNKRVDGVKKRRWMPPNIEIALAGGKDRQPHQPQPASDGNHRKNQPAGTLERLERNF